MLWWPAAIRASDNQPNTKPPIPSPTPGTTSISTATEPPATTSRVNHNGRQLFDVKTYGAVGDGSTDDTAAIRSAITAASAAGGVVFFPPGVFVLPSRLACNSLNNVSFQGSGKSLTTLKSTIPGATPPRNGAPTMLSFSKCSNFSIRDITFDNNNIITTALQTCLVSVSCSTSFTVSNCAFINAKRMILAIQSSSRFVVKDNYFSCAELDGRVFTGAILLYYNISQTSAGQIVNNEIIGAGSGGRGVDIVWSHNRITNFGYGAGIYSGHDGVGFGTHNWNIIGNSITGGQPARDANGFYPKGIEVYAPRTKIIGNSCSKNSGTGIVFGGHSSVVADNFCFNNGLPDNDASGIAATYVPPYIDPSNSVVTGNTCRNIGAGFQHYGFSYAWGNLSGFEKARVAAAGSGARIASSGLHFSANNFSGNLLGDMKRVLPPGKGRRR
jgi:hypothetical protein